MHDLVIHSVMAMYEPVAQPRGKCEIGQLLAQPRLSIERAPRCFAQRRKLALDG